MSRLTELLNDLGQEIQSELDENRVRIEILENENNRLKNKLRKAADILRDVCRALTEDDTFGGY